MSAPPKEDIFEMVPWSSDYRVKATGELVGESIMRAILEAIRRDRIARAPQRVWVSVVDGRPVSAWLKHPTAGAPTLSFFMYEVPLADASPRPPAKRKELCLCGYTLHGRKCRTQHDIKPERKRRSRK